MTANSAETPKFVADTATRSGVMPLNRTTLIGLAGAPDHRTALIILASGRVVKGARGEDTPAGQIIGIGDDRIVLKRKGRTQTLKLPGAAGEH